MKTIDYESLKAKLEKYLEGKVCYDMMIQDESKDDDFKDLCLAFGNIIDKASYIESFRRIYVDTHIIYMIEARSFNKPSRTNYIAYTLFGTPIFLITHSENSNDKAKYVCESYSTYNNNDYHLNARIKREIVTFNDTEIDTFYTLDKYGEDYNANNYRFYYDSDELLMCEVNDKKYFKHDGRFDIALKRVNRVLGKIGNEVDDNLECNEPEEVKVYVKEKKD